MEAQRGKARLASRFEFWLCAAPGPVLLTTWLLHPWTSGVEFFGLLFFMAGMLTYVGGLLAFGLIVQSAFERSPEWKIWTLLCLLNAGAMAFVALVIAPIFERSG